MQGTTCNLVFADMEFEANQEHPDGYSEERWVCHLSQDDSSRVGGMQYIPIANPLQLGITETTATSGVATLEFTRAIVDVDEEDKAELFIPVDSVVRMGKRELPKGRRSLASRVGTLRTLVVRVVDSQGLAPESTVDDLRNDVFEDAVSLRSQYQACSHGKLRIEPYRGQTATGRYISDGVVEIQIDYNTRRLGNFKSIQDATLRAAYRQIGNLDSEFFDLVMFCLPPGTGEWIGYAFVNLKFSFYNNKWCSSVSSQLHEVGHNLGLAHSGQDGGTYDDQSGAMGYSYLVDDQKMCFNPAKNYQLGWYTDQSLEVNPLAFETPIRRFVLNGVTDYQANPEGIVVLRLLQTSESRDYYIGYNRKHGINADTFEDGDTITIVRKNFGLPHEYGNSTKVAALVLGGVHAIENYNGIAGRTVQIKYVGQSADGVDATIEVIDVQRNEEEVPLEEAACTPIIVETRMDKFPDDISWTFVLQEDDNMVVYGSNPVYDGSQAYQTVSTTVCLPYDPYGDGTGAIYKFIIVDKYGDGLCCGQGDGMYRLLDGGGGEVFKGGQEFQKTQEHLFRLVPPEDSSSDANEIDDKEKDTVVENNQTLVENENVALVENDDLDITDTTTMTVNDKLDSNINESEMKDNIFYDIPENEDDNNSEDRDEDSRCQNDIKQFAIEEEDKIRSCYWVANKDRCDTIYDIENNIPYWKVCKRACKRCNVDDD